MCSLEDAIADHERGRSVAKTATEVMKSEQYDAPYEAPADPWAHRSAKMRCRTCMWFVGKAKPGGDPLFPQEFGRCRRHAPTMSGFPAVYGNDWCGDHKLDEAKA